MVPQDALSEAAQGLSLKQKSAKFQNVNLATNDLVAPGEVLAIKGIDGDAGQISRTSDGVFSTEKNVPIDSSWTAEYLPVQPTIKDLTEAPADYPEDLQAADLALLDEGVVFPVWGAPGREATVDDLISTHFFDPQLVRWREVYDKAKDITKDAKSPYEAVAAIESYFQSNYKYDEKADYSRATDGPLPSFFLDGKTGYCQMYAGTMTVMLRMLGIPARVGEGFTEGTRNVSRGTYNVTDRDAHAWVEVWFPKFGWMPFEPTPSRELPFDYSTTSKNFSDAATKSLAGVAGFDSARLEQLAKLAGTPSRVSGAPLGGGRGPREGGGGVGAVVGKRLAPGLHLVAAADRRRAARRAGPGEAHALPGAVPAQGPARDRRRGAPRPRGVRARPGRPAGRRDADAGRVLARCCTASSGSMRPAGRGSQSRARYGPNDGRAYDAARGARTEATRREARAAAVARPDGTRPRRHPAPLSAALNRVVL